MVEIVQTFLGNKTILFENPYLVLGLVILGIPGAVTYYIYRQLSDLGFRAIWWPTYFTEYIRVRRKHAWPIWPVHLSWLSLVIGAALLFLGVSRL
jgi:hypothetical protein